MFIKLLQPHGNYPKFTENVSTSPKLHISINTVYKKIKGFCFTQPFKSDSGFGLDLKYNLMDIMIVYPKSLIKLLNANLGVLSFKLTPPPPLGKFTFFERKFAIIIEKLSISI